MALLPEFTIKNLKIIFFLLKFWYLLQNFHFKIPNIWNVPLEFSHGLKLLVPDLFDFFVVLVINILIKVRTSCTNESTSKAFDLINHGQFVHKLDSRYDFHTSAMGMVSSFLRDRSMVVEVDGVKSTPRSLSSGVPHGCIPSPLFFLCLSMICVLVFLFQSFTMRGICSEKRQGNSTKRLYRD
jgi:hypothetical protein